MTCWLSAGRWPMSARSWLDITECVAHAPLGAWHRANTKLAVSWRRAADRPAPRMLRRGAQAPVDLVPSRPPGTWWPARYPPSWSGCHRACPRSYPGRDRGESVADRGARTPSRRDPPDDPPLKVAVRWDVAASGPPWASSVVFTNDPYYFETMDCAAILGLSTSQMYPNPYTREVEHRGPAKTTQV